MIKKVDIAQKAVANEVISLQKEAYMLESQLVGFDVPTIFEKITDLQYDGYNYYAYCSDNEIVGICALEEKKPVLTIAKLFVKPSHFRKGIAKSLLTFIESWAIAQTFQKIIVGTATLNTPATKLYLKMGYNLEQIQQVEANISLSFFEKRIKENNDSNNLNSKTT